MSDTAVEDIYELTPLQQGMLFHTLYAPDSAVYNIQLNLSLDGDLSESAMQQAWRLLVERHTPLRTSFVWERVEKPYQIVQRHAEFEISRHDWRTSSVAEQEQRLHGFLKEDRERLFDLTRAPLMRLALMVLSDNRFRLIWTFHHIILEGWSAAILLAEFWKLYNSLKLQHGADLPPVRPYANYIRWLQGRDQNRAERYWRKKLKGFRSPPRLPIDRSISSAPAEVESVGTCTLDFSQELTQALKSLGKSERVTLNTLVQGAWAMLLSSYSGESDVSFGAVVSGRPADLPGAESTVGLFVNTLPARVKVSGDQLLMPWLRELQLEQAAMREYEESSLMQVQAWSELPGGQPLFHSVLGFENWLGDLPSGEVAADLHISNLETYEASDQPLTLFAVMGDTLRVTLMYDTARFDATDVQRMLSHFQQLLESITAAPHARISEVSLLGDAERERLLVEWSGALTEYPREHSIVALFEEQVKCTPQVVAVVYQGRELGYAELNARANQLAKHLLKLGVGPEVMVGICVERSLEMVVGVLGILKAGGAYVPLDPDYPQQRLAFMLDDTAAPVLLTQSSLRERLPAYEGEVICLDTDWPHIAHHSRDNPQVEVTASNMAYVIYTSGSTGQPKGVCIEHRSVVRLVRSTNYVQLGPEEIILQFAPISFDASTFELWGSLLNGAKLVVFPAGVLSLKELARVIREQSITTLWLTAALFNQMVDEQLESLRGVRQLLAGGEALSPPHVQRMLESLHEGGRLINGYGPTENTTFTCCHVMQAGSQIGETAPIGRPISNTQVYILDKQMQPAPIGVYGELYIGGDGLAREYWRQPQLTAERFVADPFSGKAGARLYRSGDLVRYRTDSCIEFLGRVDHQLKIRGFRIEPGEIETTLAGHPQVRDAVVVVREDEPGDKRLVAYVVVEEHTGLSVDALREHVREVLPEYMLPSKFVLLDTLPLTPNGKVDRQALPAPNLERQLEEAYVAPRTDLEVKLAAIWREVLRIEKVGVNDNFFDMGGNSLLLTRVHGKFQELVDEDLRVVDLFQFPTIRALTGHLEREQAVDQGAYDKIRERAKKQRAAMNRQQHNMRR